MKKFSSFLIEEKNTHMEHIEDNVLNGGVQGARESINFLRGIRDMLAGGSNASVNASVKWDGAPAVFAGTDPSDGKFFVAKKGVFNKNPKVYKTDKEIDADTSGDLSKKLKLALKYLPDLNIQGVIQGDFLYAKSDLKKQKVKGKSYITFHPNTIVYAVPTDVPLAGEITRTKIGIVWHTKYTGNSFETMKATFGENIADSLTSSKNVWSVDAEYKDVAGSATLTKKDTDAINTILSDAGKTFNKIDAASLNAISDNGELLQRMKTFLNTKVRKQQKITNVSKTVIEMVDYFMNVYQLQLDQAAELKTEKGRAAKKERVEGVKAEVMKYFSVENKANLENILTLMNHMVDAKEILIKQMNKVKSLDTFLLTDKGFKATGQEGFVAIDKMGKNAVKLVDRMNFSYANFSPEVKKGWQR
jgi:hypothetical protein